MNAYNLGITGSWWLFFLLAAVALAFTIFTYRFTIPDISGQRKTVLVVLRSIALTLLLFVLFEPVFTLIRGTLEEPKLTVLIDNSISTGIADAKGNRRKMLLEAIEKSNFSSMDKNILKTAIFDSDVQFIEKFDTSLIKNKGQSTDISKALGWVTNSAEEQNTQAVLLISDGVFNSGINPVYTADVLGKPVFTIGIGDSTEARDVSVQSVLTNDVAYLENPIPVNVCVKVSGYQSGSLALKLFDNGNLIATQNFNITPEKETATAVFEFNPKTEGIHKLTASVSAMEKEVSTRNNSMSEFVNVLKNKRQILILAGSPSPDVSFIRNAFAQEKGVEVKEFIQKKGTEFYDKAPTEADFKQAEIIALIGFPIAYSPDNVLVSLKKELEKGKSLLFIASQFTDYNKLRIIDDYLPFSIVNSNQREYLALPDVKPEAVANPLLRINGTAADAELWNQLPPVFRTETFVRIKPESEVVVGLKVNNVPMKEPLILSRTFGNKKTIAVLAYGLYRWKLMGYASEVSKGRADVPDIFDRFIQNSVKWLSVSQDNKLVNIKTTKRNYLNGETVEFIGQVYDVSYNPIENATVQLKISSGSQTRDLFLTPAGNGRYTGKLQNLPEGDYFFTGNAVLNGKNLGSDKGRFGIGDVSLEYLNLSMNATLLRNLSSRTGGKFYTYENCSTFLDDLKKLKNFVPRSVTLRNEFALWHLPWLLALSLLCFAVEWFLRKHAGML
ncbi:MAG: hypothetical protein WCT77_13435 [Bacteroidota bacterium]